MVKIVTDSSADLPQELIQQYGISVVPLTVLIDDQEYQEGVNLTPQEFYAKMAASRELPKTSMPSPQAFSSVFSNLAQSDEVICINISSKLSGTYRSASLAAESFAGKVAVFDTLNASLGHGLFALKAAEMAAEGKSKDEILRMMELWREKMGVYILLNTLENIVKGGRLSWVQGSLSMLLDVKILCEGVNGSVEVMEKAHGKRRALKRLLDVIAVKRDDFSDAVFGITHVECPEDVEFLTAEIQNRFQPKKIITNYMGSTIATYTGKGGLIISYI